MTDTTRPDGVLAAYAEGRIHHLNRGLCPDEVAGYSSRDPDCPVCAALTAPASKPSSHGCHWKDCPHGSECVHAKPAEGGVMDADPIGYLPAHELDRIRSGHEARMRSAKFGPSKLDGDVPVYLTPASDTLVRAAQRALTALELFTECEAFWPPVGKPSQDDANQDAARREMVESACLEAESLLRAALAPQGEAK